MEGEEKKQRTVSSSIFDLCSLHIFKIAVTGFQDGG
jgi:hypothetical protein